MPSPPMRLFADGAGARVALGPVTAGADVVGGGIGGGRSLDDEAEGLLPRGSLEDESEGLLPG